MFNNTIIFFQMVNLVSHLRGKRRKFLLKVYLEFTTEDTQIRRKVYVSFTTKRSVDFTRKVQSLPYVSCTTK